MNLMKAVILLAAIFILISPNPANMQSNFNKLEQLFVSNQNKSKQEIGIIDNSFFYYNQIRPDQSMLMNDNSYMVFYHNGGFLENDKKFASILDKYILDDGSLQVYTVNMVEWGVSSEPYLEFIIRDGLNYYVHTYWDDYQEIKDMPFKKIEY